MINSNVKPIGVVTATLLDKFGNVKQKEVSHNMIVTSGCELIASLLSGIDVEDRPSHMALGTDSTETVKTMTALGAEISGSRKVFDDNYPSRTGAQITYTTTFGPTIGTGVLREVGIFNAATDGVMMNRVTFPIITKESSDTLIVQWAVEIA